MLNWLCLELDVAMSEVAAVTETALTTPPPIAQLCLHHRIHSQRVSHTAWYPSVVSCTALMPSQRAGSPCEHTPYDTVSLPAAIGHRIHTARQAGPAAQHMFVRRIEFRTCASANRKANNPIGLKLSAALCCSVPQCRDAIDGMTRAIHQPSHAEAMLSRVCVQRCACGRGLS